LRFFLERCKRREKRKSKILRGVQKFAIFFREMQEKREEEKQNFGREPKVCDFF
jgi:hypothetical protein